MKIQLTAIFIGIVCAVITEGVDISLPQVPCTTSEDCALIQDAVCSPAGICECPLGSVVNSNVIKCLPVSLGFGAACEDNVQCSIRLLTGGTCLADGTCGCAPGFHYLHGRCLKTAGLNEACKTSDECYENYNYESLSCVDQTCVCSTGFYLHPSRAYCRRLGEAVGAECFYNFDCQFAPNVTGVCVNGLCRASKHSGQFKDSVLFEQGDMEVDTVPQAASQLAPSLLEEACSTDTECRDLDPHAVCSPLKSCWCEQGFYYKGSSCVRELGETCSSNSECQHIANAKCRIPAGATEGACSCNTLYSAQQNNQYCVRLRPNLDYNCQLLKESCQNFGPLSYCAMPRCECEDNSHFVTEFMSCWKTRDVHESCSDSRDCLTDAGDMVCDPESQQCECNAPDFYETTAGDCRRLSHEIGDACSEDADCGYGQAMCIDDLCGCATGYFPFTDEFNVTSCATGIGGQCASTDDCTWHVADSLCDPDTSMCVCDTSSTQLVASEARDRCLEVSEYGGPCEDVMQCREAYGTDSTCVENTCRCVDEYHYRDNACWPIKKLTEKCTSSSQCFLQDESERTECRNGFCVCRYAYVQNGDNTDCTSTGTSLGAFALLVLATALMTSAW